jgi:hypothetical protein
VVNALAGVDLKFSRAFELVDQLERGISDYLASKPFELVEKEEPDTGALVVTVHIVRETPIEWSALVGDAIHNARSALDHLAWQLVAVSGGVPEKSRFPFKESRTKFGDELRSAIPGTSAAIHAIRDQVRALEPWGGGDEKLWLLHRLDIVDKHRLLIPVASASRGILLGFEVNWPGQPTARLDPPLELLSKDRHVPLTEGVEVFRDERPMAQRDAERSSPIRNRTSVMFEMIFAEGSPVAGEPVGRTLRDLIEHARSVLEPLMVVARGGAGS